MKVLSVLFIGFVLLVSAHASPKNGVAIFEKKVQPEKSTFAKVLKAKKPKGYLLIETKEDAKKYFSEKDMKSLAGIDFDQRKLVVFAWSGSGKDKIEAIVKESYPEQISFIKTPGRTRDLRQHFIVYSVRKNVTLN